MKKLLEQIELDKKVNEDWKKVLGSAAIAGAALLNPVQADAKPVDNRVNITMNELSIDREKLLTAIKQVESSGGVDKRDRYEAGVDKQLRARLDKLGTNTRKAIQKYGFRRVATSYGPYQIMASTAYDMGFQGAPEELRDEKVNKKWASELLGDIILSKRTQKLQDVISAYNAGLGRIGKNPDYINKVMKYYK